jgi:Lar family restriction alleviation protein
MADDPQPCPFCGSARITLLEGAIGGSYAAVVCQDCHATGPEAVTREEARSLWNSRDGGGEGHHNDAR